MWREYTASRVWRGLITTPARTWKEIAFVEIIAAATSQRLGRKVRAHKYVCRHGDDAAGRPLRVPSPVERRHPRIFYLAPSATETMASAHVSPKEMAFM